MVRLVDLPAIHFFATIFRGGRHLFVFHDPVKILPLRTVDEESIQRRYRENSDSKTAEPCLISNIRPYLTLCLVRFIRIPLECFERLDGFCPTLNWSGPFPKDLVFDVDDLMKDKAVIDWQFLTLGVKKPLQRSSGLLNRH
jgi:hypothetical protein